MPTEGQVEADADLASALAGFTNIIMNERVRAYNEGVEAERARKWETMESAPRDGCDVVLAFWCMHEQPGGPFREYRVCQWDSLENSGWLLADTLDKVEGNPTHWLPLTSPDA